MLVALASNSASAASLCPSAHLEPTLNYGRAIGNADIIAVNLDNGRRKDSEELAFQYIEYQSPDLGFDKVFAVHVLRDPEAKIGRIILARLKAGKPVLAEKRLSEKTVALAVAIATPAVLATRFRDPTCEVLYTDGHIIQAAVHVDLRGVVGGEAYSPIPGTSAGRLEVLGRALRAVALGELAESTLEAALKEKGVLQP
jgi:hypothetical protein